MNTRLVPVLEDTEAVKSSTQYTTNTNIRGIFCDVSLLLDTNGSDLVI